MTWRYLFGPVTAAFAQHNLLRQRQAGSCLGFDAAGTTDLKIGPADTWEEVRARLPAGWQPDFVVLYLQYTSVPACLWSAPVPRVGLAGDWNLLWHAYRRLLRRCDLTFTDSTGVETMAREGIAHVRPAHLFGLGRRFAAGPQPLSPPTLGEGKGGGARDIDVLFVGNLHPAVQRERLPWLARLARLGERWRVAIRTGVFGEDYRNLLGRARIVFNRAIRGECNMRAFEAAAAGALLFQEAGNCEVPTYFRDRQECVYYTGENLETLLEYYLEHEDERQAIAAAAREKARTCLFEDLWDGILGQIDEEWPALQERSQQRPAPTLALSPAEAREFTLLPSPPWGRGVGGEGVALSSSWRRPTPSPRPSSPGGAREFTPTPSPRPSPPGGRGSLREGDDLMARTWQQLGSMEANSDPALVPDLAAALAQQPKTAWLHNALGLALARAAQTRGPLTAAAAEQASSCFRRALACDPSYLVAGLNLTEALFRIGQKQAAAEQAHLLLERVNEWERAGAQSWEVEAPADDGALAPSFAVSPWDASPYPPGFDHLRVEWERAAWANAGQRAAEARAKFDLVCWRLHTLLAELTGDLSHYYEAVLHRPDLPPTRAALGCALGRLGRASAAVPHLRQALADNPFDREAARALCQALAEAGDRDEQSRLVRDRRLLAKAAPEAVPAEAWFGESTSPGTPPPQTSPLGIVWEGDQLAIHSLALVNRELCLRLIERGHNVSLIPTGPEEIDIKGRGKYQLLAERFHRPLSGSVDVHLRLQWPPQFTPPAVGHWVIMQPWEYGSLPRSWIEPMKREVDEIWVPSHFVRDCFVRSGIPADHVYVVPLGVDPSRFNAQAPPLPLKTAKRLKFLFVGGTIPRKGIDLLLEAYTQTFTCADDVCLVIKAMGVGSFYRGQTAESRIAQYRARAEAPEIEYIDRSLTEDEQAGLYTTCHCLVHPYRGEGFGLPIAEAMASGLPVIVTGYGAALDFCNDANAFLVPARVVRFDQKKLDDQETVDYPWWAEPNLRVLKEHLRYVFEHPAEARVKGQAASAHIRNHFTWDDAAEAVEHRLQELRQKPIRRMRQSVAAQAPSPSPSHLPAPAAPLHLREARVSLCMIVKNEETNLPACLESVADLVDEIVVVDTGSTDRTKEIAGQFGARVYDFAWVDSFAAARNESLRHATGDWIFWLDADDRLDDDNRCKLRALFAGLKDENVAYNMKCLCLPDPASRAATVVDHIRLFRRHPYMLWRYRVHEQILPAVRRLGGEVRWADVVIQHAGYQDPALRLRKLERDLRLLRMDHTEFADDPFILFNLGCVSGELGYPEEALTFLRRSLELSQPGDSIVRKLYALIVQCHRRLGQGAEALVACRAGRAYYPDDVELLFQEGLLLREHGERTGAEACWLRLLERREGPHFASVDTGLHGYKARHNLAVLYLEQGRAVEAEAQWQAVLAEQPEFDPAWLGLGDLHLAQGRWQELDQVVEHLEGSRQSPVETSVLRARGHLARKEFTAAREILQETIAEAPQALWPRVVLTQVLLQEGRDWAAAEQALKDVLALDPSHTEAQRNLEVLLRQHRLTA